MGQLILSWNGARLSGRHLGEGISSTSKLSRVVEDGAEGNSRRLDGGKVCRRRLLVNVQLMAGFPLESNEGAFSLGDIG